MDAGNRSEISEEETDPIGNKILESVTDTEMMDTESDQTDKGTEKNKEMDMKDKESNPKVIYNTKAKKANKKPTTKKPKSMDDNERKQKEELYLKYRKILQCHPQRTVT